MRSTPMIAALLVVVASPLACGGGTPPPNDESSAKNDDKPAASSASDDKPAAAASASDDKPTPSPASAQGSSSSSAPSTSGDIKPPADDPWLASHQMPLKDVMKTMRAAQGKVQACWKAALKKDPSTSGEVKLKFVITNDGAVRVWKDDASSMSDADVTTCVGEVLNKQKFPKQKSPGDAWGTYSIHFGG
jgi:hypothetical protein